MTTSNFSYYSSQTINHDSNTDRFNQELNGITFLMFYIKRNLLYLTHIIVIYQKYF